MKRQKEREAKRKKKSEALPVAAREDSSVAVLTKEDNYLWQKIVLTVRPMKNRGRNYTQAQAVKIKAGPQPSLTLKRRSTPDAAPLAQEKEKAQNYDILRFTGARKQTGFKNSLTKLNSFEAMAYRRLARGQMPIDARLDLHGFTQSEAHDRLLYFIRTAQARGQRHLLIITGKGRSPGSEGVLQKCVPHWLSAAPFRIYIAAVASAAREHGGLGAFYVRLRRVRN